jgi:hypothetical protein
MNFELVAPGPKEMTVRSRCEALDVSEQGYYAHCVRRTAPSAHAEEDAKLSNAIAVALVFNSVIDPETGAHGPNESMHIGVSTKTETANMHVYAELATAFRT